MRYRAQYPWGGVTYLMCQRPFNQHLRITNSHCVVLINLFTIVVCIIWLRLHAVTFRGSSYIGNLVHSIALSREVQEIF